MKKRFLLKATVIICLLSGCIASAERVNMDKRCQKALKEISWNDINRHEATAACEMLHDYLISHHSEHYEKISFTTHPVAPYYFVSVNIEREINPNFAINALSGVVPKNSAAAIEAFAKHINILATSLDAVTLAHMFSHFQARDTEEPLLSLPKAEKRPLKIAPPEFKKESDGSVTLTYYLKNMGRSTMVRKCTLHFSTSYQVTINSEQLEP